MNKKRRGKSRYLLSVDIMIRHDDFEEVIPAKIVYVRDKNNRKKWIAFISTDTSLSEEQIIALYGLRWQIEPFFKILKSYFHIEKEFQTRSFDAITAHTCIVMTRYIVMALRNRESKEPGTICDVFFALCKELDNITFKNIFSTISETIINSLNDYLHMSIDAINGFLAYFMSIIPDHIKLKLGLSVAGT